MRVFAFVALLAVCAAEEEYGARLGGLKPSQLLKSYQGFVNDVVRTDDAYRMEYHVGDSYRLEERTDSGEVQGKYAFKAPEGAEFEFKYVGNGDGFQVEGDALPVAPEFTNDVQAARDAFFEAYAKQAELTKDYDYDSESDEDDEESSESSEEDSDEDDSESESDEDSDEDDSDEDEDLATPNRNIPYPYSRRS